MRLLWVEVDRFRNLQSQRVALHPRYNLLVGSNGQGKTNFLEAVGYLGSLRSIRSAGRTEMIGHGQAECRVAGESEAGGVRHDLAVTLSRTGRTQLLDGQRPSGVERYLEALAVEAFVPEDVALAGGAPALRRRALDRAVFEAQPAYADEYRRYLRALRQRNALLRRRTGGAAEREGWDRELAQAGGVLVARRVALLRSVNRRLGGVAERLGLGPGLALAYSPSFPQGDGEAAQAAEALLAELQRLRDRETAAGHTLAGPHRDDATFLLGRGQGVALGRFGSQGQKRAAVLALRLALADAVRAARGGWPVVLLDDVASELDSMRRRALGEMVREMDAQFLVTATGGRDLMPPEGGGMVFRVEGGRLERSRGGEGAA